MRRDEGGLASFATCVDGMLEGGTVTWILSSWKSLSRGASLERLWGISERASVLVFLFLGGFLLGCHEVFPPFERFCSPKVLDRAP